ncbi:hypothetical protein TNCV_4054081 [Trichonephila clavipes]|nr:hypothetical protein TNCV_4054081 [Trichonephila clavipes]
MAILSNQLEKKNMRMQIRNLIYSRSLAFRKVDTIPQGVRPRQLGPGYSGKHLKLRYKETACINEIREFLQGKVIWITGSSSGIGEYLSYELAHHGCKLILSGTSEERLNSVKLKCIEIGLTEDDIYVLPFKLTDFEIHGDCVKKVLQKFRRLDILINNAGRSQRATFEEIDINVDKEIFDINVFGTLNLTRKILPHFIANGRGHFVVTSSCVGKMGAAFSASYTGSKHALHERSYRRISPINDTGPPGYRGPNVCNCSPTNRAPIPKKRPRTSYASGSTSVNCALQFFSPIELTHLE